MYELCAYTELIFRIGKCDIDAQYILISACVSIIYTRCCKTLFIVGYKHVIDKYIDKIDEIKDLLEALNEKIEELHKMRKDT